MEGEGEEVHTSTGHDTTMHHSARREETKRNKIKIKINKKRSSHGCAL
jgi:hypothetical protein